MKPVLWLVASFYFLVNGSDLSVAHENTRMDPASNLKAQTEIQLAMQQMAAFRAEYPDDSSFFTRVYDHFQTKAAATDLNMSQRVVLLKYFVEITNADPSFSSRVNFALLRKSDVNIMACLAVKIGNLEFFKHLVETGAFLLNDDYCCSGFRGNASVIVARYLSFFDYAVTMGLDTKRPVINAQNRIISFADFYYSHNFFPPTEIDLTVPLGDVFKDDQPPLRASIGSKRSIDKAFDEKSATSNPEPNLNVSKNMSVELEPDTNMVSDLVESPLTLVDSANNVDLKEFLNLLQNPTLSQEERFKVIRASLKSQGVSSIKRFVEQGCILLETPGLFELLREGLADDFGKIAEIYAADSAKSETLLNDIQVKIGNHLVFSKFVFEILKTCNRVKFTFLYLKSVKCIGEAAQATTIQSHDYSKLSVKMQAVLAFLGVSFDLIPVVLKVHAINPGSFDSCLSIEHKAFIHSFVKSASMFKLLMDLNVKLRTEVVVSATEKVPALYHFLNMKAPDMQSIILSYRWHPTYFSTAFRHAFEKNNCDVIKALHSMDEVHSKILGNILLKK